MMGEDAKRRLEFGAKYPYDGPDEGDAPPAIDWAHAAARGILSDLGDRGGIKHELGGVDEDVRAEIVEALSSIIRTAATSLERETIERCVKVAEAHEGAAAERRRARGQKLRHLAPEVQMEIQAEERGEDIASQIIASKISALALRATESDAKP